jgi:hypothetical protein
MQIKEQLVINNFKILSEMKKNILLFLFIITFTFNGNSQKFIDLSGEWQFQMDPQDQGIENGCFSNNLLESIKLPGSMVENGKGYDITFDTQWTGRIYNRDWKNDPKFAPYIDSANVRFPFWLQPEKKYTGAAWYRKEISVPADWEDKTIILPEICTRN